MEIKKYVDIDGSEVEFTNVSGYFKSPDEVEQFAHELLQAAFEWRADRETRAPGPPTFKTFDFSCRYPGCDKIASWLEHPWALVRRGGGTSIAFLVKEEGRGFKAWMVKFEIGEHRWENRSHRPSKVEARDIIQTFPHTLPDSPTLKDIELAREKVRASRGAPTKVTT
jgi:hypothetical protein